MTRKAAWAGFSFWIALMLAAAYRSELDRTLLLTAFGLAAVAFAAFKKYRHHVTVCFVFFSAGVILNGCYTHFVYDKLVDLDGQTVTIQGHIKDRSQLNGNYERVIVRGRVNGIKTDISFVLPYDEYRYYDEITVTDTVNVIKNDIKFDCGDHNYSKGIFLQGGYATGSYELSDRSVTPLFREILNYRDKLFGVIISVCSKREGAFLGAMLCGDKSEMTPSMKTMLYRSGLGHIFAVSGIHLVIVVSFFSFIAGKLIKSKHAVYLLTLVEIWGFVVFAGMSVSVVRAAIMLTVTRSSPFLGRKSDGLNSLGLCAIILLVANPYSAISPSFVLSFLAVLAIEIVSLSKQDKDDNKLERSMRYSSAVLFTTAPASAVLFGGVSVMSVISNLLLVPVCTFSLQICFLILFSGGSFTIARPLLHLASFPVRYALQCSDHIAELDFSYIFTSSRVIFVLIVLSSVVMTVLSVRIKDTKRYMLIVATVIAVWSAASNVSRLFESETVVSVLPKGKMTAYVVSYKGNAVIFDVGCCGKLDSAMQRRLDKLAIRKVSYAFISKRGVLTANAYHDDFYTYPEMVFINDDPLIRQDDELTVLKEDSTADIGSMKVKPVKNGYEVIIDDHVYLFGSGKLTIDGNETDISGETSVLELKGTTLRRL